MSECAKASVMGVFDTNQRSEAQLCAEEKGQKTGWPHFVAPAIEVGATLSWPVLEVSICTAEAVAGSEEVARQCYKALQKISAGVKK